LTEPEVDVPEAPASLGQVLLDAVAVMDRLRSPGGCPWDAEQDHRSLAPYLIEEAYETIQAIEDNDLDALRDELGDVLLQVLFHARIAAELPPEQRWTIDDVAAGLVAKMTRRHPHVFGDTQVSGSDDVSRNWEQIKAAERGGVSPVASVPMGLPALTLAAKLQRKGGEEPVLGSAVVDAAQRFSAQPTDVAAAELLWLAVSAIRANGIDPEAVLRARGRAYRDEALGADS
jgi:XTP/dITP diphosphohydrolase